LIEPLVAAARENECVGIAVLDRARLRLLTKFLGQLREHIAEEFDHRAVRHTKTVGMNSLGAASHTHERADEQIRLNLQQVIHEIDLLVARQSVRHLVLAGSTDIVAKLKTSLPKRLASLVIGTADIATNATGDQIMSVVNSLTRNFVGERENATVRELVTLAEKGAPVVIGFARTLDAANQGRIWKLVCADHRDIPGYECTICTALFSSNCGSCSFCGSPLRPVRDVVERAIARVSRNGTKVDILRGEAAASLRNAGGIGAFLRTRTGNHGGLYESERSSNSDESLAAHAKTAPNAGNS
jgi:peptide subunit release factor 1 (eRF1)